MGTSPLQKLFDCEPAHARLVATRRRLVCAIDGRETAAGAQREIFERQVLKSQLDTGTISP